MPVWEKLVTPVANTSTITHRLIYESVIYGEKLMKAIRKESVP